MPSSEPNSFTLKINDKDIQFKYTLDAKRRIENKLNLGILSLFKDTDNIIGLKQDVIELIAFECCVSDIDKKDLDHYIFQNWDEFLFELVNMLFSDSKKKTVSTPST